MTISSVALALLVFSSVLLLQRGRLRYSIWIAAVVFTFFIKTGIVDNVVLIPKTSPIILTIAAIALLILLCALVMLRDKFKSCFWLGSMVATIFLALLGYAIVGRPDLPARPAPPKTDDATTISEFETARAKLLENTGDTAAWLAFADALTRQGRGEDAVQGLQIAIKAMPDNPDLWVGLGDTLTRIGDGQVSPAARMAFDRANTIDPDHPAPYIFLALAWIQAGEPDEAEKLLLQLKARAPADAPFMPAVDRLLRGTQAMQAAGIDGGRFPAQAEGQ